ncbi:MAG TPA: RNA-binding S4 domain-containing protein [Acholeplasma sp.]|mgnify:CR=1 FL=1|nr:RNA-binding S4 domain-containing protein [Acholeplasma sp.]
MKEFVMTKEVITLTQFLKANDYINSGGEAKYFLKEYVVLLNDVEVTERGKKLYPNDLISIGNDRFILKHD